MSKYSACQVTRQSSGLWLTCHPLSTPKLQVSPKRARKMLVDLLMVKSSRAVGKHSHSLSEPSPNANTAAEEAGQQVMRKEGQGGQSKTRSWTCKLSIISKQPSLPLLPTTQLYQASGFPWRFCRGGLMVGTALCYVKEWLHFHLGAAAGPSHRTQSCSQILIYSVLPHSVCQ